MFSVAPSAPCAGSCNPHGVILPSVVASELEQVAAEAIRISFHTITPGFRGRLRRAPHHG
jgi:hypothetical protein